ncbi:response regulator [Thiobacillus sedimenti]|uniref:Tetratricopeptide repeat protein n=1 Tax=Thiobacillus sedimenti TaxID=3110231 RepID=A0ABZ1CFB1_9PROT|nr:tetratricopeptide repeat protein [Thiobacillus sp. SCUT-2]WRS37849.1 tetratricopeptide repeat protein [Thiobacillus sp. SCUT-2]
MSLKPASAGHPPIDYAALRALVVDDSPGMRNALRLTLANFGITKIQMAANAAEAIFQIKHRDCDFILCDFNLGEGRDGQQLLEELRHSHLIALETVFMMVTAESYYEKVVATAELAPDDYMIKPFSAEVLRSRLEGILLRKRAFREIYRQFEAQELDAAIAGCDALMRATPKYAVDAMRFKGELLVAAGRFDEAEALYQQVINMRAIPWARLGLARALHLQNKDEAAEGELRDVLDDAPEMVSAYDLLSDVCLAQKNAEAAQAALEQGVAISGKTVRRQQKLGEVAHANGDLDTARAAYAQALEKGRHSIFVTPADYGNLCRVQLEQGDAKAAAETLKRNKSALQASPEGQLVMAVTESMVHARDGALQDAAKALDEASRLRAAGARGDAQLMLDLAGTCMTLGRNDEADAIVGEVARNAHDSDALLAKARRIYDDAGRPDAGAGVLSAATGDVRQLNNEGVVLAQRGDFRGAVDKLLTACGEAPFNPRIIMNAVWVILKYLDQVGMDEGMLESARAYLAEAERQAPGHARIAGLRLQMRELENRFGIRRKSAA